MVIAGDTPSMSAFLLNYILLAGVSHIQNGDYDKASFSFPRNITTRDRE